MNQLICRGLEARCQFRKRWREITRLFDNLVDDLLCQAPCLVQVAPPTD
jgi:hypothetical protein